MADKLSQSEIDTMLRGLGKPEEVPEVPEKASFSPQDEEAFAEGEKAKKKNLVAEKVGFAPFKTFKVAEEKKRDLNFFNKIPLVISGELGTANLTVRQLLKLEEGSVIKLDKLAGESAAILINGQYLGLAEIVVINERFGLRVTAIGPMEEEKKDVEENKEAVAKKMGDGERQEK